MCVVSMIGDHYSQKYKDQFPQAQQQNQTTITAWPNRQEFEALKKEVLEMKELLKKAKVYDEVNNQKDCEMEEKIKILKAVADAVGVSLEEVFGKKE